MKKLISLSLVLVMAFGLFSITVLAVNASPTSSTVLVNGKNVAFDAYNIGGNNYFKLRDLASTLNGTPKQFEVGYDDTTKAITLTSGKPYTRVGGEMEGKDSGNREASPTSSRIYMDGKEVQFTAYNIGGNNYFKLRDIGEAFDFGVDWDQAAQTIRIDTSKGYTPEGEAATKPSGEIAPALVSIWVNDPKDSVEKTGEWLELKDDGTYRFYHYFQSWFNYGGISTLQVAGNVTETGNYTVQGDKLRCTNIKRSIEITGGYHDKGFIQKDKQLANIDRPFRFGSCPEIGAGSQYLNLGLTWLYIDMRHPDEMMSVGDMEFELVREESKLVQSVGFENLNVILGWPEALPDILYPTGYGGVVTRYSVADIQTTVADDLANHRHTDFEVEINTDKDSLLPYFDYLEKNGFTKYIGIYHKSLMINGVRYEVQIQSTVGLNTGFWYILKQEDTPSYFWDEEWD